MPRQNSKLPPTVIGWCEMVGLPDFGIKEIAGKIDTGARTSAIHAIDQEVIVSSGHRWVEFSTPQQDPKTAERIQADIIDEREVKNSGGVPELRLIVRTSLLLGPNRWPIEVSLTDRAKMEFDLILGRTAIRGKNILVNPGRSYRLGSPHYPNDKVEE